MKQPSEKELLRREDELDKMGWRRLECSYWEDPITGLHEPSTQAYELAMQRRKGPPKQRFRLKTEIVTSTAPNVTKKKRDGWGDKAVTTVVEGKVLDISIIRDGSPAISFRVLESGDLIITNYGSSFSTTLERNVRLTNDRPWKTDER